MVCVYFEQNRGGRGLKGSKNLTRIIWAVPKVTFCWLLKKNVRKEPALRHQNWEIFFFSFLIIYIIIQDKWKMTATDFG